MTRPKHRRCQICGTVTARYIRTQDAGQFAVRIFEREAGEVLRRNGTEIYCHRHAPQEATP